ncbi:MAG: hypothetical protein WBD28_00085 [Candidatus Zixiibacteriota bacterium]
MAINRLLKHLSKEDYISFFGLTKSEIASSILIGWTPQEIEPCREMTEVPRGAKTKTPLPGAKILDDLLQIISSQIATAFARELRDDVITELFTRLESLEEENKSLKKEVDKLRDLHVVFDKIQTMEKELDAKILKEMPELKFKKKDPFVLEKGDWALPYEKLKKVLEE